MEEIHLTGDVVIAVLFTGILYFMKAKIATWDKHISESHAKDIDRGRQEAVVKTKLDVVEGQLENGRKTMHWIGDCVLTIGSKLDVKLPDRPE